MQDLQIPTIYGNYDYALGRDLGDCGCAYGDQHDRDLGQRSVEWTLAHTDKRAEDFMRHLPFGLRFKLGGKRVRLVHGSPRKVNEYLFEDKPARTFERIAAGADCDITHLRPHPQSLDRRIRRRPVRQLRLGRETKDHDPRASFAILEPDARRPVVHIERAKYDAESVAREVASAGLPKESAEKPVAAA